MNNWGRREFLVAGAALPLSLKDAAKAGGAAAQASPERFEGLAGYRLSAITEAKPLAIIPCGSLEYHGPHNPFGADSIIISGIAEHVAERTGAMLFPTVTFTHCPAHTAHFPGTLSVSPEVMTMYYAEILRAILGAGFGRIFMLNGHDGNIGPARGAISQVTAQRPGSAILFASWWEALPRDEMVKLNLFHQSNGGHGHGGPLETSAVAAFRPDWVHVEKARDLPPPPDLSTEVPYYLEKDSAEGWPGYSGKVSEASPEKGREIVKISEDRLVALVENWMKNPTAPGSW
ncbi:MAG TPA: creatininase family protein [Terriglobia bacterium]|nr:creatininase family protein [Terriglobia bacterium]